MWRKIFNAVKKIFKNPSMIFVYFSKSKVCRFIPDKIYLSLLYKGIFGEKINLENPKTFSEKLQWLKLYDRNLDYTMLVDKYEVRKYIKEKLGEDYLIPMLGVWDNPNDIEFDKLPNQFVLKCNHNSGLGMCICKDKSKLDVKKVKHDLKKGMKQNFYLLGREWPYKNVKRKIIAEKYMKDSTNIDSFTDYKFYCFNGYVDNVMVCLDRNIGETKFYFFDRNWELLRYNVRGKDTPLNFTLPKPDNLEMMFKIAEQLSKDKPFSRIDLYNSDGKIYFGEITFFPESGLDPNILPNINEYFGELINLKKIESNN